MGYGLVGVTELKTWRFTCILVWKVKHSKCQANKFRDTLWIHCDVHEFISIVCIPSGQELVRQMIKEGPSLEEKIGVPCPLLHFHFLFFASGENKTPMFTIILNNGEVKLEIAAVSRSKVPYADASIH